MAIMTIKPLQKQEPFQYRPISTSAQTTDLCPTANVGDSGVVDGVTYTKRLRADIETLIAAGPLSVRLKPPVRAALQI